MATKKITDISKIKNFLEGEAAIVEQMADELEQVGTQAGSDADDTPDPYTYCPANENTYAAICPDCEQLVPSGYNAFASQEAADEYAREHCDCNKQTGPDILLGVCRFCGQAAQVPPLPRRECTANEHATRNCSCDEAKRYQHEIAAKERREKILQEAHSSVDDLFKPHKDTDDSGEESPRTAATLELLKLTATLVYDRVVKDVTVSVTYSTKAKISRTSKGNLAIERKDSASEKTEVATDTLF